ncbi:MAG TPA: cyclase family protein [Geobacteraceae bacterium]|mgnify:CR=1 FL=1|nr:cyclase family protein [Geobacteraceae bacterium]
MMIYDISVPLAEGLPAWPGDPELRLEPVLLLEHGDGSRVSRITLGDHSGTHLDAPSHMVPDGASLDEVPLSLLMGRALVADLRGCLEIGVRELSAIPLEGVDRLLLLTDNSGLWKRREFTRDYVSLNAEGAEYLVRQGVRLVGIDYLSIERFGGDGSVHRTLLGKGVVILEGLDLSVVDPGDYELVCLPLRIPDAAGAPARAVLKSCL